MGEKFVVCSMPRSGSAWVSALFNLSPYVICFHEAIANPRIRNQKEHFDKLLTSYHAVGDCCGTYMDPDRITPGKCAWIERDEHECFISSELALERTPDPRIWNQYLEMKEAWINRHKPVIINFVDLFTIGGARFLWESMVNVEFPATKVQEHLKQNVQRNSLNYDLKMVAERIEREG